MTYSSILRRAASRNASPLAAQPVGQWRLIADSFSLLVWLAVFAFFLYCVTLSVTSVAQLIFSASLLGILVLLYLGSRIFGRLQQSAVVRLGIIFICTFLVIRYIYWRATESMPLQFGLASAICGLLLFAAEFHSAVTALLGYLINAQPYHRRAVHLPEDPAKLPHVDVYIPTYNEDPAIIRATVIAATQMHYPADKLHVYILDDGGTTQKLNDPNPVSAAAAARRSGQLKAIAERFGAGYITRERNVHAKAGNMNNALSHTSGELLAILDCDHIPSEDFIERLVGFFLADPKLFVVQTPHNFVSPDPLERNLDTYQLSPAENELFYDVMQPGLDAWGTSFFCGSAAMLRREVIDRLGGISGQTITEDAETTLDAMSMGYGSAYYGRPMVSGLQPETFSGFIIQRVRWGQGMWQIFLLKNPWKQKGLRFLQRVLYTNFAFYWGFAFSRMVMLLAPPAFLVFGINLCDTTATELIAYAGPALLASLVATQYFYGRVRWPFISQLYEILQSLYLSQGLMAVIRKPRSPAFKVTPKGEMLDRAFISSMSVPFYVLLVCNLIALGLGFDKLDQAEWDNGAVAFVMFWAALDMILLLAALGVMLEKKQTRAEPRVVFDEPAYVRVDSGESYFARVRDVSGGGAGLTITKPGLSVNDFPIGTRAQMVFPTADATLQVQVMNVRDVEGGVRLGLRYCLTTVADERNAIRLAFGSSQRLIDNNRLRHSGRSIVRSLFTLVSFALSPGREHLQLWIKSWLGRRQATKN